MAKQRLYNGVRFPMESPSLENVRRIRTLNDIYWLAGMIEGEGHFRTVVTNTTPVMSFGSSDFDIALRVSTLVDCPIRYHAPKKVHYKPMFRVDVTGRKAVGWMLTLYSILGKRRQQRIRGILITWGQTPNRAKSGKTIW